MQKIKHSNTHFTSPSPCKETISCAVSGLFPFFLLPPPSRQIYPDSKSFSSCSLLFVCSVLLFIKRGGKKINKKESRTCATKHPASKQFQSLHATFKSIYQCQKQLKIIYAAQRKKMRYPSILKVKNES